jgi:hypothetical protein
MIANAEPKASVKKVLESAKPICIEAIRKIGQDIPHDDGN